jgi:2,3-bisphosphoglycerate-dependent phosphoglycerate mutase
VSARHTLVLQRHGQNEWDAADPSTAWIDIALSGRGDGEARRAGRLMKHAEVLPTVGTTSLLRRAISTVAVALDQARRDGHD